MHVFCLVRVTAPIVPDSTNKSTLCRNFFVKRKDKLALFTKMTGHCWGGLIMCPHNGRTPALISSVSAFQKHWLTLCTSGNLSSARRITYYRSMRRSLQFQLGEEWWMNFSRVIMWSSRLINDIKGFKLFVFRVQFFSWRSSSPVRGVLSVLTCTWWLIKVDTLQSCWKKFYYGEEIRFWLNVSLLYLKFT